MGIDTGAYKKYRIEESGEPIFEEYFDDIEGVDFKYPNAEFFELAETIKKLSDGSVDLGKYLIWDYKDYINPNYSHTIDQLSYFSFESAIIEGEKAKVFIENYYIDVKNEFRYIFDPMEIIDYLIEIWRKGYYVAWDF